MTPHGYPQQQPPPIVGTCLGCRQVVYQGQPFAASARVEVEAKDMYEVYRTNEVRADQLYTGKAVRVRGIVGEVQKDVFGDVMVEVRSGVGLDLISLFCYAKSGEEDAFSRLPAGKRFTVAGRIEGKTLNRITGKDCVIMSSSM
jgi:hypothetical protein